MPPRTRKKRPTTSQRRNPPPPHHASPPPTSVPPVDSLSSAATTSTYTGTAYQSPLQDSDSESPIKQDCHQALEAFHRGNTKESFKIIKRSLSRHPNSAAVHRTLAFMHFQFSGASDYSARVQHFQKAAASSEKSLAISPKQIGLLFLHNQVLFELACDQEDCDRIIKQCQEALQIQDPIDPKNNIIVTRKETEAEDLATKDARIDSAKRELRQLVERVNQILQPHNESKEEGAAEKKDTAKEKDAAGEKNSMEDESGNYLNLGKPLASFVETRKAQEQIRHSIESILKEIRDLEIRLSCGYVDVNGTEEDERKKLRQSQVLDYWKRLSGEDRRRVLRVNIGEIMDYYANKKSIITLLTQAIDFWKKRGRWKFWSCCCCEEMHVEGVCWIDHVVAEHLDLPSSEKQEMFLPPKVDPAWADKIVNGVWKPIDVNKILKDTEGQETQAEIYRDEGKWPICEDSKREEMLKEIHAVLKLFLSNDCLSQSFVSGLIDDSNNHLQMSDRIPGLDQTPLCICFLGSDKLQQTLKLLQQISRQCQFTEPREDGIFYDEIHGEECTEMITLADDFSCLLLHECFLTGEVESQKCSNAVPDDDNFVYWLYRSYDIEELTKTWTNCRSVKMLAATQAVRYQKLTFKYQLSLCKAIRWLAKYEQAFDAVNKICLAEENKRVHIPQHKPQSFLSLLLKRRDEIAGITDGDGMFEHRFIMDVLKLTKDTCVEHFGFEEVLIGMNTQLSDLKVAEDNEDSRITIQAAAAEPYLRQAMLSKLVNVRAQLFSFDALLMKSLADTRWMHHNFSMMPFHDYQPIMLHLVKSFLQAHLECFADNAARRAKGRHEPLLMLRQAALTVEKSKVDDDSRDEGKNTKNTKGKDKKKIEANLGIKEPQPSRKKNKEIILPTTSAGDDPDTRITSEMQEEDAPSSQISYNEMIELERNLEYQQKFEEEAKQKQLAEKKKNIIDNKPQNAEDEQLRRLIESEGMHIGQMIEQQKKIEDGIKQNRLAEQNKKISEASIENTEDEMPLASKPGEVEKSSMPEKPPQNSQTLTVPVNTIRIGDLEVPLVSKPSWADRSSVLENPSSQFSTAIRIGDIYCKLHFPTEACSKPGETNVPIEHVQLEKSATVTLPGRDTAEVGDSHPPQAINVGLNETRNDSGEGKGIPDTGAGGIMYKPDAGICNDSDVLTMDHVLPHCRFFNRTKTKRSKGCKSYVSEDRGYSSEPEFGSHHHHVCLTCNAQPENLAKLPVCLQAAVWYFSRQNSERPLSLFKLITYESSGATPPYRLSSHDSSKEIDFGKAAIASGNGLRLLLQRTAARTLSPFRFSSRYSSSLPLPCFTASSSSSLPLLLLPSEEVAGGGDKQEVNFKSFLSLKNSKISSFEKELSEEIADAHCAGSSNGWLAFVNRRDCSFYLADLFTSPSSPKLVPLPSILSLPRMMGVVDDSSSSSSIKHFLQFDGDGPIPRSSDWMSRMIIRRLAMSSTPILENGDLNRNCIVMISTLVGHDLSFCRIGDNCWTNLGRIWGWDIVYSKRDKLFYCITSEDGDVKAWDFNISSSDSSPKSVDVNVSYGETEESSFCEEVSRTLCHTSDYLVESPEGDILVLVRYSVSIGEDGSFVDCDDYPDDVHHPYRTVWFDVFKLDPEKQTAEVVKNLGDTVIFVGLNESFSLSARDHPELQPNSIYFADDHYCSIFCQDFPYGGDDMGIYHLEDHSVAPLYHPFQFKKIIPPPIWVSRRP